MRRIPLILAAVFASGIIVAACNYKQITARCAAHRLYVAIDETERGRCAARLVKLGDVGTAYLIDALRSDEAAINSSVVDALTEHWESLDENSRVNFHRQYLEQFESFSQSGKAVVLGFITPAAESQDPDVLNLCREIVRAALKLPDADARVRAVRLSLHPKLALAAEAAPLLHDESAEVRRAAILAVGPVSESGAVVSDEELFTNLNDSDIQVRMLCQSALISRGLSNEQIDLARHLTSPDPAERLDTLIVLRQCESIRDPGPWLDRLSHDSDPAIRVGAARAAYEQGLLCTKWLDRLAQEDLDANVRRWAEYYRGLNSRIRAAEYSE